MKNLLIGLGFVMFFVALIYLQYRLCDKNWFTVMQCFGGDTQGICRQQCK